MKTESNREFAVDYATLIRKYPCLDIRSGPHEALVLAAYMAGRVDMMTEEIERFQEALDRSFSVDPLRTY